MKLFALLSLLCVTVVFGSKDTCSRVGEHGYPCEKHMVQTKDGYKLNMFRLPYSHNLGNQNVTDKTVVFLMHGLLSSSDSWVFNGPNDGLLYMLVDAGYDVWLGNNRGNDYSQKHVSKIPLQPSFWAYSWHEIGTIDIPAKIDYIRAKTGQQKIHYVGHSQGTTAYFVMLSTRPEYNDVFKTTHLLAPVVFMEHMASPLARVLGPLLDNPSALGTLMGSSKFTVGSDLVNMIMPLVCFDSDVLDICTNILYLAGGGPSPYFNKTLLPSFFNAHPSDSSTRQLLHYLQVRGSKQFRQYDRGLLLNMQAYGSTTPPIYNLNNVQPQTPIDIYYSDNDDMASVTDVEHLLDILGDRAVPHHISLELFNHLDYLICKYIKEMVNDNILNKINLYEGISTA